MPGGRAVIQALRRALVLLLMCGALLRPMLTVACEQHALAFAHPAQPHAHTHAEADEGESGSHGDHQLAQFSAGAGAAAMPHGVAFVLPRAATAPLPQATVTGADQGLPGAPFRPPIG